MSTEFDNIIGADEALIEAGNAQIKREMWKGELLELLKGLRNEKGWEEYRIGRSATAVAWHPEGHSNYFMRIEVKQGDPPPQFLAFVDPDLHGNTAGWRTERDLKNYKQVIGLPKSLQAWVMSDIEKIQKGSGGGGGTNSYRYGAMQKVAARGVPHDLERAYQKLRQILIPAVEPEDTHAVTTGYDESRALTEGPSGSAFEMKRVPVNVKAGQYVAPFVDFLVYRFESQKYYQLSLAVIYSGLRARTNKFLYSIAYIYDDAPDELVGRHYGGLQRTPIASLDELNPRTLWTRILDYRIKGGEGGGFGLGPLKGGLQALLTKVQGFLSEHLPEEVEKFTREKFFHVIEPEEMHTMTGYDEAVKNALDTLRKELAGEGVELDAYESHKSIHLARIVIPKNLRGQGLGTRAMHRLTDYADKTGQRITLTPSTDFGASSTKRLITFYKQFGFLLNRGSHKDFTISELMYRDPQ